MNSWMSMFLNGKSLLDLPSDNPAYVSVKDILKTLGYI